MCLKKNPALKFLCFFTIHKITNLIYYRNHRCGGNYIAEGSIDTDAQKSFPQSYKRIKNI